KGETPLAAPAVATLAFAGARTGLRAPLLLACVGMTVPICGDCPLRAARITALCRRIDKGGCRSYLSPAPALPRGDDSGGFPVVFAVASARREALMLGLQTIASRVFGSSNDRKIKPKYKTVGEINALEPRFQKMSDDGLRGMTAEFRSRLADGESL